MTRHRYMVVFLLIVALGVAIQFLDPSYRFQWFPPYVALCLLAMAGIGLFEGFRWTRYAMREYPDKLGEMFSGAPGLGLNSFQVIAFILSSEDFGDVKLREMKMQQRRVLMALAGIGMSAVIFVVLTLLRFEVEVEIPMNDLGKRIP